MNNPVKKDSVLYNSDGNLNKQAKKECSIPSQIGEEIRVGSGSDESMESPEIVTLDANHYLVAWQLSKEDSSYQLNLQLYDASHYTIGDKMVIRCPNPSREIGYSIASLVSEERIIVAYEDTDSSGTTVAVNLYDYELTPLLTGLKISGDFHGHQFSPYVSVLESESKFFVTYEMASGQNATSIYGTVLDRNGNVLKEDFRINADGGTNKAKVNAKSVDLGNLQTIVIIWESEESENFDIFFRLLNYQDGYSFQAEVNINQEDANYDNHIFSSLVAVSPIDAGETSYKKNKFYITWQCSSSSLGSDVCGSLYYGDGSLASYQTLNQYTYKDQSKPCSVYLKKNAILLTVWNSNKKNGSSETGLYGQALDTNINRIGSEFLLGPDNKQGNFLSCRMGNFQESNEIVVAYAYGLTLNQVFKNVFQLPAPISKRSYDNNRNSNNEKKNIYFHTKEDFEIQINANNYDNYNGNKKFQDANLVFQAHMSNGEPLPNWIHFYASELILNGTTPSVASANALAIALENECNLQLFEDFNIIIHDPTSEGCDGLPKINQPLGDYGFATNEDFVIQIKKAAFLNYDDTLDRLTYTTTQSNGDDLPSFVHFDHLNLNYWGTTPNDSEFNLGVALEVSNQCGKSVTHSFTLSVNFPASCAAAQNGGKPILVEPIEDQTFLTGEYMEYYIPRHISQNYNESSCKSPLLISVTNTQSLPQWIQYDPIQLKLSGDTPDEQTTITIDVQIGNECNNYITDQFKIIVGRNASCYSYQRDGGQYRINAQIPNDQAMGRICALPEEQFIVAWSDNASDGDGSGIFASIFDSNHDRIVSDFLINTGTGGAQRRPSIAYLESVDRMFISYESASYGIGDSVVGKIFDKTGEMIVDEFVIQNDGMNYLQWSRVTALAGSDRFAVVYMKNPGVSPTIHTRIYNYEGEALSGVIDVQSEDGAQEWPRIASFPQSDDYLIVWGSTDSNGVGSFGQRFNNQGNKVNGRFLINTYQTGNQQEPVPVIFPDDSYFVCWHSQNQPEDSNGFGIFGQFFNIDNTKNGGEFMINTYVNSDQHDHSASIIGENLDQIVVVWESESQDGGDSSEGVYGQIINKMGKKIGEEFQIHTETEDEQYYPEVTNLLGSNKFVITWPSKTTDSDDSEGIYAQNYDKMHSSNDGPIQVFPENWVDTVTIGANADFRFQFNDSLFYNPSGDQEELYYTYKSTEDNDVISWLHLDSERKMFYGFSASIENELQIELFAQTACNTENSTVFTLKISYMENRYCPSEVDLSILEQLISNDRLLLNTACDDDKNHQYLFNENDEIQIRNQRNIHIYFLNVRNCTDSFLNTYEDIDTLYFKNANSTLEKTLMFINSKDIHLNSVHNQSMLSGASPVLILDNIFLEIKQDSSVYFHNKVIMKNYYFTDSNDNKPIINVLDNSFIQFSSVQFENLYHFNNEQNLGLITIVNSQMENYNLNFKESEFHKNVDQWLIYIKNDQYYQNIKNVFKNCINLNSILLHDANLENSSDGGDDDDDSGGGGNKIVLLNSFFHQMTIIENEMFNIELAQYDEGTEIKIKNLILKGNIAHKDSNNNLLKFVVQNEFQLLYDDSNGNKIIQNLKLVINQFGELMANSESSLVNSVLHIATDGVFEINKSLMQIDQDSAIVNDNTVTIIDSELRGLNSNGWLFENNKKLHIGGNVKIGGDLAFSSFFASKLYINVTDENYESPMVFINGTNVVLKGEVFINLEQYSQRSKIGERIVVINAPNTKSDLDINSFQFLIEDHLEWKEHNIASDKMIELELLGCAPGMSTSDLNSDCIDCPMGTFSKDFGTHCNDCPTGHFNDQTGKTNCMECPVGKYSNQKGLAGCTNCEFGTFQNETGTVGCRDCGIGTFANKQGLSKCLDCLPGSYTNSEKTVNCKPCAAGTFNIDYSQTVCSQCEVGNYQDEEGKTHCKDCDLGTFANEWGLSKCLDCLPGSYTNSKSSTTCQYCLHGTASRYSGQRSCDDCYFNTFQPNIGSTSCNNCPMDSVTLSIGNSDVKSCLCSIGYYGVPGGPCLSCPEGGVCNTTNLKYPDAKAGYWHSGAEPNTFLKCAVEAACPGGKTNTCNETLGYIGEICSECTPGFYKFESQCLSCPDNQGFRIFLIFIILYIFVFLMFILAKRAKAYFGSFTIAFSFLQILAVMNDLNVEWPANIRSAFKFALAFNFNLDFLALECTFQYTWLQKWVTIILSPFLFLVFLILVYLLIVVHSLLVHRLGSKILNQFPNFFTKPSRKTHKNAIVYYLLNLKYKVASPLVISFSKDELRSFTNNFINCYSTLLTLIYLILSLHVLQIFDCTKNNEGEYYLDANPKIQCYSSSWYPLFVVSLFLVIIYIIGIPLVLILVLIKYSRKLNEVQFDEKFGLLCCRYSKSYFYWEIVVMVRKLFFVIFQIYLTHYKNYQLILCIFVLFVSLLLQFQYKPYLSTRHNHLEFILLFVSEIILFSGLIFTSKDFSRASKSRQSLSVAIVLVVWVSISLLFSTIFFEIRHRVRVKRGKETDEIKHAQNSFKGIPLVKFLKRKPNVLVFFNWQRSLSPKQLNKSSFLLGLILEKYFSKKVKKKNALQRKVTNKKKLFISKINQTYFDHIIIIFLKWYSQEKSLAKKLSISKLIINILYYIKNQDKNSEN
ncbi:g protein-coupled receptor-related [Anaeramoeba flamelloides]|uniref:G protein-coupled receptor-related n=1 Tax=Anaeramoeba flamelloides TaxID=1746091 RepID=A0ABQ8YYE3_9EUKA|nr:g protein-coupled receptor-related [Anaeramoeba flamelloides]